MREKIEISENIYLICEYISGIKQLELAVDRQIWYLGHVRWSSLTDKAMAR